jgi:hypothetical protein
VSRLVRGGTLAGPHTPASKGCARVTNRDRLGIRWDVKSVKSEVCEVCEVCEGCEVCEVCEGCEVDRIVQEYRFLAGAKY